MSSRIIFMGTPSFAVPTLEALGSSGHELLGVVTQPDRPKGRGKKLSSPPVKEAALEMGLEVFQPARVKEESFIQKLKEIKPDLIVVVAFGQILPRGILTIPPLGCINVHASILPMYRGAAPMQWALMEGEVLTGITTMLMDEGLDTGDMLLQETIEITPDMNFGTLHDLMAQLGAGILTKTLTQWKKGQITPQSQKGLATSYAPLLKREDELIRWEEKAVTIHNKVRALSPWPGAYTLFQGKPLKIKKTALFDTKDKRAKEGTVIEFIKGKGFVVQSGEGSLLVSVVQPFGKKEMPADSFINGYSIEVGYVFNIS